MRERLNHWILAGSGLTGGVNQKYLGPHPAGRAPHDRDAPPAAMPDQWTTELSDHHC